MNNTTHARIKLSRQNSNSGFTLLELMIVIVIVGIMFSFLALSIRNSSPAEAIQTEIQRLDQLIALAAEEAILRGEERAIVFTPNSYEFARMITDDKNHIWQSIQNDRQLRKRELPHDITIELEVDKSSYSFNSDPDDSKSTTVKPQVFLLSSGEFTPEFTVHMVIFGVDTSYRIDGKMNGQHSISNSDSSNQ